MTADPIDTLTSEDERFLLRLIYFPDSPPLSVEAAIEQRLLAAGLVRREFNRLVVTEEGLRYFVTQRHDVA